MKWSAIHGISWYADDDLLELTPGAVRLVQVAVRFLHEKAYQGQPARIYEVVGTTLQGVVEPRDLKTERRLERELALAERRLAKAEQQHTRSIAALKRPTKQRSSD